MRIKLDQQEVAAIIQAWAYDKYKSHNISVSHEINKGFLEMDIEITMLPDELAAKSSPVTLSKAAAKLAQMQSEPEFGFGLEEETQPLV